MRLSELWIYPVKSLAGISLDAAQAEERGLRHDRRWVVVAPGGVFLSQRQLPGMAQVRTAIAGDRLVLRHRARASSPLEVPLTPAAGERLEVTIWGGVCEGLAVGAEADAWLTQALGVDCRLVALPDDATRRADTAHAPEAPRVGYADEFPYLVAGQGSLDELNRRLPQPLPMLRFRPNLVVEGAAPFAEDEWGVFEVGSARFRVVKPCARCAVTTVDPESATYGQEPLRTLATFRRVAGGVLFGQNAVAEKQAEVRVGDEVRAYRRGT